MVMLSMSTAVDTACRGHPWLRIQRLIREIRGTPWTADEWAIVEAELREVLKERRRMERAGWFNS